MPEQNSKQTEELRHERKFLITGYSAHEIEQILKFHSACFSPIYHKRQVNNIYFDTMGFSSFYGNVEGDQYREKARIRWYGEMFGKITNPVLEFKIKQGLLGNKLTCSLNSFTLDKAFSKEVIESSLNKNVSKDIQNLLLSMNPTLLNSYIRTYFISADKNFRITIDRDLCYYKIAYHSNTFLNKVKDHQSVILELKYSPQFEQLAKKIGQELPFMMTKNSKYLQGIEKILL